MKLLANWWDILTRAWSMRFMYMSIVFGALEYALPYFQEMVPVPDKVFGAFALATSAAAAISRLLAQPGLTEESK